MPEQKPIRTYRGSEAPLAMLCAGSVNAPADEILIDSVVPAGTVGTATHIICQHVVEHDGRLPLNWQETCVAYGLDAAQTKEVGSLIFAAKAFWDANKGAFPEPKTEVELIDGFVSGHVDVISVSLTEYIVTVIDWKTTRLDIDYTPQMLTYAWLAQANHPDSRRVKTVVVYLRDRTANIKEWDLAQIEAFRQRFINEVIGWDGRTYRPGGHCAYCRRFANCPAHKQMVQQAMTEMVDPLVIPFAVDSNNLRNFYGRIQAVEVLAKKAREHVRAAVEQAGGELPGLKLVPSHRDTIDAKKAWPVLTEIMEPDQFADAVTISKKPLLDAYAASVPKGKGKAKKELMEALNEAGAVTKTEFSALRVVQNNETKEIEIGGTSETD